MVFVPVVVHWTSSIPFPGCWRVHVSFPNQYTCFFVDLEKAFDCVLRVVLPVGGALGVWGLGPVAKGCPVPVRPEQELGSYCWQ